MKAMVLAAGLGTRLRPLTDTRPKALVELNGRTMLEITLTRLREFGVREVIVNVHHFPEMIVDYLRAHDNFGMWIEVSREDDMLLDTGGGLKRAARFFVEASNDPDEPFLLHNVDVLSAIDLSAMVRFHREQDALATLAVQQRASWRLLLFDSAGLLVGHLDQKEKRCRAVRNATDGKPIGRWKAFAFSGIHVISQRLLKMMTEQGAFSIIETYLRLAGEGERIIAFPADAYYWRDLGTRENLTQAEQELLARSQ